jgi:hypothetical protein
LCISIYDAPYDRYRAKIRIIIGTTAQEKTTDCYPNSVISDHIHGRNRQNMKLIEIIEMQNNSVKF